MMLDWYRNLDWDWELERAGRWEDLSGREIHISVTGGSAQTISHMLGAEALETRRECKSCWRMNVSDELGQRL